MLIGGVAVIAHGVRRLTDDVDVALWAEGIDLAGLVERLSRAKIEPRIENAVAFAKRTHVLLLRHRPSGIDIDLSLSFLPFEDAALDHPTPRELGRARIPVARPADLVVYKAIAARERDRSDIERLLEMHGDAIDLSAMRRRVEELGAALDRPEILIDLDRIIARLGLEIARPGTTRGTPSRRKKAGRARKKKTLGKKKAGRR